MQRVGREATGEVPYGGVAASVLESTRSFGAPCAVSG